jgi:hypothetical protein
VNADRFKRRAAPVLLLLAAACLLAAAGGWLATALPEMPHGKEEAIEWKLPTLAAADAVRASQVLAGRNIWDASAAPGAATGPAQPLTPPDWRIMAAVVAGKDRTALIRVGNEAPFELRVGDKLPGGAIIRGIEVDRLIIELNGKRRILRLSAP